MNSKILFPLIGIIAGILISSEFSAPVYLSLFLIGSALLIWITLTYISREPVKGMKYAPFHVSWVIILFAGIGSLDFYYRGHAYSDRDIDGKNILVKGLIEDISYLTDGDKFKLKVMELRDSSGKNLNFQNLKFIVKTDGFVASKGDIIEFPCQPTSFQSITKGSSYNWNHQGYQYYAKVKFDRIKNLDKSKSLYYSCERLKGKLVAIIENSSLERSTGDFITSLLLGDRTFLHNETREMLSSAGMAHILALSGMHVAILFSIVFGLLFPLSLSGLRKTRYIITVVVLWLYILLTGFSPSSVRAVIMATCMVTAILLERKNSPINALSLAALLILLFDPLSLWNIGFQMSFICVAMIILFTDRLNPVEQHVHPKLYKTINLILVTLIATFGTWTLVAYYFGNVPLLFLPANFILLPLLPWFVGVSILYVIFLTVGIDLSILSTFLDTFHHLFLGMADILSFSGAANLRLNMPLLSVVCWIAALFTAAITLYSSNRRNHKLNLVLSSLFILTSLGFLINYETDNTSSLKFKHSFTEMEAIYEDNNLKSNLKFPRNNISRVNAGKFNIIAIDQVVHPDSLENLYLINNGQNHFLIAGPGSDVNQLKNLIENSNFAKIILHSGIGKNKKAELLHLLDPETWDKIYSLRDNGSFDFDL